MTGMGHEDTLFARRTGTDQGASKIRAHGNLVVWVERSEELHPVVEHGLVLVARAHDINAQHTVEDGGGKRRAKPPRILLGLGSAENAIFPARRERPSFALSNKSPIGSEVIFQRAHSRDKQLSRLAARGADIALINVDTPKGEHSERTLDHIEPARARCIKVEMSLRDAQDAPTAQQRRQG